MKYILRFLACFGLLICSYGQASAQYSNPILTAPHDVQGAALGQVSILADEMPIYSMPSLVLRQKEDKRLRLAYSFGLTPEARSKQVQYYHRLASAYRFKDSQALMLGVRYWQGAPTPYVNTTITTLGVVVPQDWTIDVSYAYAFIPVLRFSVGVSYLNTYSSQTSHSVMAHLGASYEGALSFLKQGEYLVGLSANNLGSKLYFGKEKKSVNTLPTYIEGAARLGCSPWLEHKIRLGMALRYYSTMSGAQAFVYQTGLEYQLRDIVALRLGGIYQEDNSQMTLGLGRDFGRISLSVAYSLHNYAQFNVLNAGLSLSL
ncbi:MAG: PorV/PorQ family protein [Porphyromonadaceae bacterium]|nr:PorV/PorQ family protein [Porphyromonadaceae bacterium]